MKINQRIIIKSFPMNSIDLGMLMVTVFVIVDDWYLQQVPASPTRPGVKAKMSDSEILTLALLMDYWPFPGETQFLGLIRANYREWFPYLLDQSQFNRRLRKLEAHLEQLRRSWVKHLGASREVSFIVDPKPLPVVGYRRSKQHSEFEGSASYGYCAARKLNYLGYKLVTLCTVAGLPVAYDLVPANVDERLAVEGVLSVVRGGDIYGDQGFIGEDWQASIQDSTGNRIWTVSRAHQTQQPSPTLKRLIGRVRQRVEGVFHEIQNTGRNPERLLNKTVRGFATHIAAKMASHTLRLFLRHQFGIDVLTFRSASV
jgi:hypothetical protein